VNAVRDRQKRNLIATLALSVGTPMLGMGDELGRTQFGNNNAYCQDNELSWVNWDLDARGKSLLAFTQKVFQLRKTQPVLQRRNFFQGQNLEDSRFRDLSWFRPDGAEMAGKDWEDAQVRCLGWFLGGDAIGARHPDGSRVTGDSLLIYINAHTESVSVTLPGVAWGDAWVIELETAREHASVETIAAQGKYQLAARALVVLRQTKKP
jgi:isoamylase